jgi:DNA-binding transcriptional LysR family regulator
VFQLGGINGIAQEAVQVQTVIGLVECGLGVALVPSVAEHHASTKVAFRRIRDIPPAASIGIALAYHGEHETPIAKRFRELASNTSGVENKLRTRTA